MSARRCVHIGTCTSPNPALSTVFRQILRTDTYFFPHSNPWATLGGPSAAASHATELSPTAELDPLLTYLRSTLAFLSRALASAPLRRITRAVLTTISTVLWENVLSRYRFSTQGATQLHADLVAVCRVVDKHVGTGVAEAGLRKCLEGVKIVGLPVKGSSSHQSTSINQGKHGGGDDGGEETEDWDTDAWGAGEEEEEEEDGDTSHDSPSLPQKANMAGDTTSSGVDVDGDLGLWEVEKRLFADNQSAREVLEDLGLELLSETEARALLRRRVELAG